MPRLRRTRTRGDRLSAAILDARTVACVGRGVWRMHNGRFPLRLRRSRRHGLLRRLLA
jgi:hypothetical protein